MITDKHDTYFDQAVEMVKQRGEFHIIHHMVTNPENGRCEQRYISRPFETYEEAKEAQQELLPDYPGACLGYFRKN